MKTNVSTVKLNSVNLNSVQVDMVELGRKMSRQSALPAPVAWYDIEKDGKNNDSPDRGIITDFSGNGRDLKLYNFAYSGLQSGYHGYDNWLFSKPKTEYTGGYRTKLDFIQHKNLNSFDAIISNMQEGDYIYYYYRTDSGSIYNNNYIKSNGWKTFPGRTENGYRLYYEFNLSSGVVIEVLPKYPNGLAFDGISDYAQFVGDLGLKDYTVILDREYPAGSSYMLRKIPLISSTTNEANTPFIMETPTGNYNGSTYSYSRETNLRDVFSIGRLHVIQTPTKYRRIHISGAIDFSVQIERGISTDTGRGLSLGGVSGGKDCFPLVLYKLLIFDVTLTTEQIKAARLMYGFKKV